MPLRNVKKWSRYFKYSLGRAVIKEEGRTNSQRRIDRKIVKVTRKIIIDTAVKNLGINRTAPPRQLKRLYNAGFAYMNSFGTIKIAEPIEIIFEIIGTKKGKKFIDEINQLLRLLPEID